MSITEYQRHQLFTWFEEQMGKERATTMMNLVPPVGWGDVATVRDVEHQLVVHRAEMRLMFGELRADVQRDVQQLREEMQHEFQAVRDEMQHEFQAVRRELRQEIAAVREELRQEIADVREEISAMRQDISGLGRTFAGWLLVSQAAVIGAVTALVAII